jgi:hypothetical protein
MMQAYSVISDFSTFSDMACLQICKNLSQILWIEIIAVKCICPTVLEIHDSLFLLIFVLILFFLPFVSLIFDSLHLLLQLLAIIGKQFTVLLFDTLVTNIEDAPNDLLSPFLTIVHPKADLHVFIWLQFTIREPFKEIENDIFAHTIDTVLIALVCGTDHFLFRFLATFDELEELVEFDVGILVEGTDHHFDFFSVLDQAERD